MLYRNFFKPVCVWDAKTLLGEGVVWIEQEQCIYFIDIIGRKVFRYHPRTKKKTVWDAPKQPTFIFPTTGQLLLCGMEDGLYWFDPILGEFTQWFTMYEAYKDNRLNDGYIDSSGRLWFGTMDRLEQNPTGALYLLDCPKNGKIRAIPVDKHYVVTNGPLIMEDHHKLYHNHSNEQVIYCFDWQESGYVSHKKEFIKIDRGYPDGMAADKNNNLWVCLFGGKQINIYSMDSQLLHTIPMPSLNITKIAFGGKDYKTVYVTTAIKEMTDTEKNLYPFAGGLFSFEVSTPGRPQNLFKIPEWLY